MGAFLFIHCFKCFMTVLVCAPWSQDVAPDCVGLHAPRFLQAGSPQAMPATPRRACVEVISYDIVRWGSLIPGPSGYTLSCILRRELLNKKFKRLLQKVDKASKEPSEYCQSAVNVISFWSKAFDQYADLMSESHSAN